jgi:hypothetical protein
MHCFFGKTFTSIVAQGIYGGDKICTVASAEESWGAARRLLSP